MKPARGFSLLELMVVIVIIGVLTAAGVPSLTTWIANTRVRSVADSLQNGIRLAQAEAVRRNASVTLMTVADPAVQTASATGINWIILDNAGAVIQRKGSEGATTASMSASGYSGTIVFDGMGLTTNLTSPTTFAVTARGSDHTLNVLLTPAGRVRMCDPARAAGDPQACE